VWLVKLPFILSDLGLGYLIYRFLKVHHPQTALVAAAVFLFNPVVIYNSAIWGQTDSLVNLLSLTGLLLIASRHHWGIFLFFLSFLFKLSLIIYLPILLVLLYHHRQEWSKFILPALTFIALALTLAWPFSASRSPVSWLNYLYQTLVLNRQGHMLNGNAFNLWLLIFGVDLSRSEFLPIFQLYTAQQFSRLLFLIINLPLWFRLFKHYSLRHLLTVTLMTAFTAFLVMTNMHERYLYPIFPVLTILVFLPSPLFTLRDLIILSIVHFLNLYNLWFYPTIPILQSLLEGSNFLLPRILSFLLLTLGATYLVKYLLNDPR
jgi:Gpi18-like mannosyltransferase